MRDPAILPDPAIRERVFVVGGVLAGLRGFQTSSNHTSIDLVAPAESVWTRGQTISSAVHLDGHHEGTSFAAPFVSGTAVLALSLDPTLSTSALAQAIRLGAMRSGTSYDGVPLVDAYQTLRAISERPGAPLCGNSL